MRFLLAALLALPVSAQISVGANVSAGPSLTTLGASGTVEAAGVPIPLGRVDFPTSVGVDARVRVDVHGETWGGRVGAGYLSASDVFDGASFFDQRSVDLAFAVASGEVTYRQPYRGAEVVVGVGPELRVVLNEDDPRDDLLSLLGDVRRSHLALGGSVGARFVVGGVALAPELRGGYALTPLSDDTIFADVIPGVDTSVRLAGDFRFNHVSLSLTVGTP